MNILFVTPDPIEYNTSANFRNRGLIQGFIEEGHAVSTLSLTCQEGAISGENTELPRLRKRYFLPLNTVHAKLTTKRGDYAPIQKIKRSLRNVYMRFSLYDSRIHYVKAASEVILSEKYDLMISSSDPKSAHRIAEAVLKSNPRLIEKWIQYWGDPFASDINITQWILRRTRVREEKALISLADAAVYVSPLTAEVIKAKYRSHSEKIHFIPTSYIRERIYPPVKTDKIRLLYAGDYFRRNRNIQPLVDVIKHTNGIELILVGKTDITLPSSTNVLQLDRVSAAQVHHMEEEASVIVCVCNLRGHQIPGKIYQAAGSNRPILLVLDGENSSQIRDYFSSFNRYDICENTVADITRTLKDVLETLELKRQPVEFFSSRQVARTFLALLR